MFRDRPHCRFHPVKFLSIWIAALVSLASQASESTQTSVPGLKCVVIDSDEKESFLGLQLDSAGSLFAGCREALFAYEPVPGGLYAPRKLLFRFPKDAWIYDIAILGDDLYVATHTAIYLLKDGVKKREGLEAVRLVWGLPIMRGYGTHQGIHALAIGPGGDVYFSFGDEVVSYGDFNRPDHWAHWTWHHGRQRTPVTGVGGICRISPDGESLTPVAGGLRNDCGLAFDAGWNLFTNDNDHESLPARFVPGRLLHVTEGAWFGWPRGWLVEKTPWRADLLDSLNPGLGRYVPIGQAYYDDPFLPEICRGSLYVAEWGRGKLLRYPLRAEGSSFKAGQVDFLSGAPNVRPVSVTVGRGGRMFTSLCHMAGNEASPVYQSEIVMITRAEDTAEAPFDAYDATSAPMGKLCSELQSESWSRRYRAHLEVVRRGADACRAALDELRNPTATPRLESHLVWFAAVAGSREYLLDRCTSRDADIRRQALQALATLSEPADRSIFEKALADPSPPVAHAALVALRDHLQGPPATGVFHHARGTDRLPRLTAIRILAASLAVPEIQGLAASDDPADRLTAILIAGERLTMPPATGHLPPDWPLDPLRNPVAYAGETLDPSTLGPVGQFTMADVWAARRKTPDDDSLFALLQSRLHDPLPDLAKQAAFFLHLLRDDRTDADCAAVLGLADGKPPQATPLKGATTTGTTELPPGFKGLDWSREAGAGDIQKGAELYATRGCAVCHSTQAGDAGGGGPLLAGAGSRFDAAYLVDAIMTPNKVVSPVFRWTQLTRKDGTLISGLVTGESSGSVELLLPAGVRLPIPKADIAKREIQDRSPMPEGLIRTPAELRDLVAFLLSLKDAK